MVIWSRKGKKGSQLSIDLHHACVQHCSILRSLEVNKGQAFDHKLSWTRVVMLLTSSWSYGE